MTESKDNLSRRKFFKNTGIAVAAVPLVGIGYSRNKVKETDKTNSLILNSPLSISSPDGKTIIELGILEGQGDQSMPYYKVYFEGRPIILKSTLGMKLPENKSLGLFSKIESVQIGSGYDHYIQTPGKRYQVTDHFTEGTMHLLERKPSGFQWSVCARAYNDGVAFRYQLIGNGNDNNIEIADERTEFSLLSGSKAWTLPVNSFTKSAYEVFYKNVKSDEIPGDWLLGVPLLVEADSGDFLAITEANLTNYAGMYLESKKNGSAVLRSRLSPLPHKPGIAVVASLPHVSPWRVVLTSNDPGALVESDLIINLNRSCVLKDISWIRSGKTTFPWWNGFYLEDVPFEPGLNTETMKYYIDFCAENNIPYHTLDGVHRTAWYGGPTHPYEKNQDITSAIEGIDMTDVVEYAKKKKVRLRLWMHWEGARAQMDEAFPLYESWGIEGVMLDFMNRDDQEMVVFLDKALQKAAEHHLTVSLHGVSKPTGLERTYPHLLAHEAVRNLEHNKFSKDGIPPEHEINVAFIRMLAGPLDFHQGSFRGVSVADFKPKGVAPNVMGTLSRTLANYVVLQNHLPMMADYPAAYRAYPEALSALSKIPTTWDDTKFIAGEVGKYIALARRKDSKWYIGVMNNNLVLEIDLNIDFLKSGKYQAQIYDDDTSSLNPYRGLRSYTKIVSSEDLIHVRLEKAGGCLIILSDD